MENLPTAGPPGGASGETARGTFESGPILAQTFTFYLSSFLPFTLVVAAIHLPLIFLNLWNMRVQQTSGPSVNGTIIAMLVQLMLGYLATAAMVYGVFQALRGRPASIADCLAMGVRRMLPALAVAIAVGVIVGAGMLLLCVPGFIAMSAFYVAIPIAVVERAGIVGSIQRSVELTSGYRWRVFFIALGLMVLGAIAGGIVGAGAVIGLPPTGVVITGWAIQVLFTTVGAVASSVIYFRLRQLKESVTDVEAIASVFD